MKRGRRSKSQPGHNLLWLLACTMLSVACHRDVTRSVARQRWEQAIERVERARFPVRGKPARAYARALAETGRLEQARRVLLTDFRRTSETRSLIDLADLERAHGLDGLAAVHYARVIDLDRRPLRHRQDVCALFERRGRAFIDLGEAIAAWYDVRRMRLVCDLEHAHERDRLAALERRTDALVRRFRRAQRSRACEPPRCRRPTADQRIERVLAEAATPPQIRAASRMHGIELPAEAIARLLQAELDGELGVALVTDDELRTWLGERSWQHVRPAIEQLTAAAAEYARLRLSRIVKLPAEPTLPGPAGQRDTSARLARLLEALETDGGDPSRAWRAFVSAGDLGSAELTLTSALRGLVPIEPVGGAVEAGEIDDERSRRSKKTSTPSSSPSTAASGSSPAMVQQATFSAPNHWIARVPVDPATIGRILAFSRLRAAAGKEDLALQTTRWALHEGARAGIDVTRFGAEEALWHLAWSRPWQAIAVAEATPGVEVEAVVAAAATAIRLLEPACADRCREDEDRALVARVLGDSWVEAQLPRLDDLAIGSIAHDHPVGCPPLRALVASDAEGPLAKVVQEAFEGKHEPGYGDRLQAAIESDAVLECAGRIVLPLMVVTGHKLGADSLAEVLGHAAQMRSAGQLTVHADAALWAERSRQAELLQRAAAGLAPNPRAVWLHFADFASLIGDLDFQVIALREALLHTADLNDAELRVRLFMAELERSKDAWAVSHSLVGRESLRHQVRELVDGMPVRQRWYWREHVGRLLVFASWTTPELIEMIASELWRDGDPERHPVAVELASLGQPAARPLLPAAPLDLQMQARWVRRGWSESLSPASRAFAPASSLDEVRLALAQSVANPTVRARMGVAAAVTGSTQTRERAITLVLEQNRRLVRSRRKIQDWLIDGPAAVDPATLRAVPLVKGELARVLTALGFSRDAGSLASGRAPR